MNTEYHVKLIQEGNTQTLTIPQELTLLTTEVIIRQEDGKLIIEPYQKKSLLYPNNRRFRGSFLR